LGGFVIVPEVGFEGFLFDFYQAGILLLDVKDDLEEFESFLPEG
jgi:hypothetical protein